MLVKTIHQKLKHSNFVLIMDRDKDFNSELFFEQKIFFLKALIYL